MKAFCIGLRSAMADRPMPRIALPVSSLPLSLTTILGLPRSALSRSSSRSTQMPESEVAATSARHPRVQSVRRSECGSAAAVGQVVRHKVERPSVVRRHRNQHRRPGPVARLRPPRRRAVSSSLPDRAGRACSGRAVDGDPPQLMASGISRTSSILSKPLSNAAPLTWT